MSKPTLYELPPKLQAQALEQLYRLPRPKTVALDTVQCAEVAAKPKRACRQSDATVWFLLHGLDRPERERRFDPDRRWRFDYAWPADMVALEVEGGVWTGGRHTRGSGFLRDMEKYNRAAVLGWRVVRCTPEQLRSRATLTLLRELMTYGGPIEDDDLPIKRD